MDRSDIGGSQTNKATVRTVVLFLFSLVLSLILGEVLVRVAHPQQLVLLRPDIWRPAERFGWRHQEDVNTVVNTGEGPVHFRTDEEGRRINVEHSNGRRNHDIRILALGDSFIEALQVENEETIAAIIQRTLEERLEKSVRVDNTGVAGWGPNHYLLQAKQSLAAHHYDLGIVFLFVGNDVVGLKRESYLARQPESHPWRMPKRIARDEIIDSVLYPFNENMERTSHLYVLLKKTFQQFLARVGLTAYYFPDIFLKSEVDTPRWRTTAEVCADIKAEFDRRSVPVLFVLLPEASQVHHEFFDRHVAYFNIDPTTVDLEQPNRLLAREFARQKLYLIDVLPELRKEGKAGTRVYGWVDDHFNKYGHLMAAKVVLPSAEQILAPERRIAKAAN